MGKLVFDLDKGKIKHILSFSSLFAFKQIKGDIPLWRRLQKRKTNWLILGSQTKFSEGRQVKK